MKTYTFVKSFTVQAESEDEAIKQMEENKDAAEETPWELVDDNDDEEEEDGDHVS